MGQKQFKKEISYAVFVLGILQAVFGLVYCIVCGVFTAKSSTVSAPFWSGVPLLLTGIFGIVTAWTRNQCMLIAWLVINILLTILLFVSAAITGIGAALLGWAIDVNKGVNRSCGSVLNNCVCSNGGWDIRTIRGMSCDDLDSVHIILQVMTAFAVLGGFVCFGGSICSCVGLCCYKKHENTVIIPGGGQQVIITQTNQSQQHTGTIMYQPPPGNMMYQPPPPSYNQDQAPAQEVKPGY